MAFEDSVPETERASWTERIEDELLAAGIRLPEEIDHPVPEVSVTIGVESGVGRTDAGVRFEAARARAVIRIRRARVGVLGAPGVSKDANEARRKALDSLIPRIEAAIAW